MNVKANEKRLIILRAIHSLSDDEILHVNHTFWGDEGVITSNHSHGNGNPPDPPPPPPPPPPEQ